MPTQDNGAPDTMNQANPAIETSDLVKRFDHFTAVDRVSFSVHRGEIFGFLGPNGAGKTTTIRMLLGLTPPTAGSARVLGYDIVEQADRSGSGSGTCPSASASMMT